MFVKGQYLPYFEQLHYDRIVGRADRTEPVNQIPYLEGYDIAQDPADRFFGWERYICTFAHDLMALPSHTYQHLDHNNLNLVPDLPHTDESNVRYKNTWHYGRAMLGYVLTRLDDWKALPMDGAENAFGLTWQNRKEGMEWIMRSICAQCESRQSHYNECTCQVVAGMVDKVQGRHQPLRQEICNSQ